MNRVRAPSLTAETSAVSSGVWSVVSSDIGGSLRWWVATPAAPRGWVERVRPGQSDPEVGSARGAELAHGGGHGLEGGRDLGLGGGDLRAEVGLRVGLGDRELLVERVGLLVQGADDGSDRAA